MNRLRKRAELNGNATPEPSSDPTFDLRRGLFWLVVVIVIMVGLSFICSLLR